MSIFGRIYRQINSLILGRPTHYQKINNYLYASGRPTREKEIIWLYNKGINAILTLTEEPLPEHWFNMKNWKILHISIEDHSILSNSDIQEAVYFIKKMEKENKKVLVHCAAGIGRTGTVLAAHFMEKMNINNIVAIKNLRELRPRSVEKNQEISLENYYKYLKNR